jgi:hypothetical protein
MSSESFKASQRKDTPIQVAREQRKERKGEREE